MPLWLLVALGLTGVALVTRKPTGRGAPTTRRGATPAAPRGFPAPGDVATPSDSSGQSSAAASLGLSDDEFSNMTNTEGAQSPIPASLGLSDQEWNNVGAAPGIAVPGTGDGSPNIAASDPSSASDDDQSVDMGQSTSTDMDPSAASFPGAEGTSVQGYRVGDGTGAPPTWTDNGDGTATDPTNTTTLPYDQAWDYYDLWNMSPPTGGAGSMTNFGGGAYAPTQSTQYDSEGNPFVSVNGYKSYGEIHPSVGAPIVRDAYNSPYVVGSDGSLFPC
jgi:hypothetical protein